MSSIVAQPIIENTATPINNNITASPSSAPSSTPSSTTPSLSSSSISATQPYASASLYVGDLNIDVTEALLFEIFNAVGPVASVRVCRDAATRRSLGYAYVNFHRLEDAERALDTLNFKMIRNRACRIMWSHRDPALRRSGLGNIFVNHLARDIDNKQLYDTFSMFGNILSCKVSVNAKRESLGYGFVHYETDESALSAIEKVDGKVINGEKISVQKFQSKKERPSAGAKNKYTNIFVKNLPLDITAEKFQELFSQYGNITSKSINIPTDRTDEKARAFGFLNYETSEQAAAAVEGGNNIELSGKKLFVGRAQKKEERQKELSERFENLKLERAKKYAGVNLFVKNLNDDVTDEKLTLEFSKFGQISSCTIMKDAATSKSRGFGFVCYTLPEEATRAVTEMHGKMYEGKPLYVALAQRKDQRRAQLEAQYAARQKLGGGQMNQMQGMGMGMQGQMAMNPMYGQQMPLMFPQQQMLQQQQRGNFGINGYPQQLLGGNGGGVRWSPQQQQMMGMGMVGGQQIQRGPQQQMNYQLMPANNNMNGQQRGGPNIMNAARGGPRGSNIMNNQNQRNQNAPQQMLGVNGGGMRQQGPPMQQQINKGMMNGQQQQLQQQQQVRYNENVRNQQLSQQQIQQQQQQQRQINSASDPLTPSALASAPEEMRKQMIGERLFPLVRNSEPNLAGKITGMLLEMDNGELLHLLESREALNEKIQEALTVLQQNPPDDEEQQ